MKTFLVALSVIALSFSTKAYAERVPAAACVPGDPAIQSNLYLDTGGTVKFKSSTGTGTITLYCALPYYVIPSSLGILKYDDSGTTVGGVSQGTGSVIASYIKMNVTTGALTTIATVNSSSSPKNSGGTPSRATTGFSDTFDDTTYAYYVRVDITRAAPVVPATGYANEILYEVDLN